MKWKGTSARGKLSTTRCKGGERLYPLKEGEKEKKKEKEKEENLRWSLKDRKSSLRQVGGRIFQTKKI